jgi:hypothetical protein
LEKLLVCYLDVAERAESRGEALAQLSAIVRLTAAIVATLSST